MWQDMFRDCDSRTQKVWKEMEADFASFFGTSGERAASGGRRRGPFGRGRMFEQGDLKLVILRLLEEKPRHGYEIIKELEERSNGRYTPSAGAIYPTLTMLEDLGYASVTLEDGGKKVYAITDAGRQHLAENQPAVEELFDRVSQFGEAVFGESVRPARDAMLGVIREFGSAMVSTRRTSEQLVTITEILRKAKEDIKATGARASEQESAAAPPPPPPPPHQPHTPHTPPPPHEPQF